MNNLQVALFARITVTRLLTEDKTDSDYNV